MLYWIEAVAVAVALGGSLCGMLWLTWTMLDENVELEQENAELREELEVMTSAMKYKN